jgi:hypothetical protein
MHAADRLRTPSRRFRDPPPVLRSFGSPQFQLAQRAGANARDFRDRFVELQELRQLPLDQVRWQVGFAAPHAFVGRLKRVHNQELGAQQEIGSGRQQVLEKLVRELVRIEMGSLLKSRVELVELHVPIHLPVVLAADRFVESPSVGLSGELRPFGSRVLGRRLHHTWPGAIQGIHAHRLHSGNGRFRCHDATWKA